MVWRGQVLFFTKEIPLQKPEYLFSVRPIDTLIGLQEIEKIIALWPGFPMSNFLKYWYFVM